MKEKLIKIFYQFHWQHMEKEIYIRELANGYIIKDIYVKDKEDLAKYLAVYLNNTEAKMPLPIYEKKHETLG